MQNVSGLLGAAEHYRRDKPERHAVILDLSGLLHVDDPVFRRMLRQWLVGDEKPTADRTNVILFDTGKDKLVLSIPDSLLTERRQALGRVAEALASHHRGELRTAWFDLSRRADDFADAVRDLVEQMGSEQYPDAPPAADALDKFMEMERTLHAVDLSSLLREQIIFRLDDEQGLVPVMVERTVSIEALDRLFTTHMRREPWLFDQATALLDRRMLYDLLRDDAVHALPIAIKLHAATVAGEEFREMTARFPARLHGKLVVEMPFLEWVADRELYRKALNQAQADEVAVAVDHIPALAPSDTELPVVDWYRIPWLGDDGAPVDLSGGIAWLGPMARTRCILTRCRDDQALEDARTLGFRYVEGAAATRAYHDGLKVGDDQRRERTAPGNGPKDKAGVEPTEEPVKPSSWWSRLFGGGGRSGS
ncbi:hypothetical protein [Niveispirillum cyanobacteriorum]|uniref:hypothetical protein n=1 Tax=Niveispirillum cyanobacteriorum TaxID=1612173 RepID=UPI00131A0E48|nr:hypothetical protein [Niveispirillum cyanobacteriorum]GGE83335.1 hypothetical protein GCM10011317_45750 [Niveispirillum cyanobacteriorum]